MFRSRPPSNYVFLLGVCSRVMRALDHAKGKWGERPTRRRALLTPTCDAAVLWREPLKVHCVSCGLEHRPLPLCPPLKQAKQQDAFDIAIQATNHEPQNEATHKRSCPPRPVSNRVSERVLSPDFGRIESLSSAAIMPPLSRRKCAICHRSRSRPRQVCLLKVCARISIRQCPLRSFGQQCQIRLAHR